MLLNLYNCFAAELMNSLERWNVLDSTLKSMLAVGRLLCLLVKPGKQMLPATRSENNTELLLAEKVTART